MSSLQDMVFNAAKDGEVEQLNALLKNLNRFDRNLVLGPKTHPNGETTTPLIMAALYSQHEVGFFYLLLFLSIIIIVLLFFLFLNTDIDTLNHIIKLILFMHDIRR